MRKNCSSKTVSELNALCDVLSFMRKPTAFPAAKQMYKHFCKPGTGTIDVIYRRNNYGKIFLVYFLYTTWIGANSVLSIDTTKYY